MSISSGIKYVKWWFQVSALVAAKSCSVMVAGPEAVLSNPPLALGSWFSLHNVPWDLTLV